MILPTPLVLRVRPNYLFVFRNNARPVISASIAALIRFGLLLSFNVSTVRLLTNLFLRNVRNVLVVSRVITPIFDATYDVTSVHMTICSIVAI